MQIIFMIISLSELHISGFQVSDGPDVSLEDKPDKIAHIAHFIRRMSEWEPHIRLTAMSRTGC
jgi:hypothetical protein